MAQFAVYRNRSARSKATFPFLVDVQSDLLDDLQTRVVVPLSKAAALTKRPVSQLTPLIEFEESSYVLLTPQLAGVPLTELSAPVGSIAKDRDAVLGALDFLQLGF